MTDLFSKIRLKSSVLKLKKKKKRKLYNWQNNDPQLGKRKYNPNCVFCFLPVTLLTVYQQILVFRLGAAGEPVSELAQ